MYRKFFSRYHFALLLIFLTFLSGCGDDSTSPPRDGFSFKLTVVDQSGATISGLQLSRRCRIEYADLTGGSNQALMQPLAGSDAGAVTLFQSGIGQAFVTKSAPGADPPTEFALYPSKPNPGILYAHITLDVPVACHLVISVFNWRERELVDVSFDMVQGILTLIYTFMDGEENYQPNGIYRCEYTAAELVDSTILFKDSVYFSGYIDGDPFRQSIGETNSSGSFSTTDKGYFPSLQGHQPQMGCDFDGVEVGLFSFSDTLEIKVLSEPASGTGGYIYWMTGEVVISDGANEIEWVFVPDDSIAVR